MAGSWLSVVEGFGGMRVRDGLLSFEPHLPEAWRHLAFRIDYRGRVISVRIMRGTVEITCEGEAIEIMLAGERLTVDGTVSRNLK